jgi:hypothetical protein
MFPDFHMFPFPLTLDNCTVLARSGTQGGHGGIAFLSRAGMGA